MEHGFRHPIDLRAPRRPVARRAPRHPGLVDPPVRRWPCVCVCARVRVCSPQNSPTVWVKVTDTGIGMAPEQLARVIQPFQQADASTTPPVWRVRARPVHLQRAGAPAPRRFPVCQRARPRLGVSHHPPLRAGRRRRRRRARGALPRATVARARQRPGPDRAPGARARADGAVACAGHGRAVHAAAAAGAPVAVAAPRGQRGAPGADAAPGGAGAACLARSCWSPTTTC